MDIQIKYTNIEPSEAIERYIREKINPLGKLFKSLIAINPDFSDSLHVWFEVGKPNLHHKKGETWYAECQIELPRKCFASLKKALMCLPQSTT